MAKPMVPRVDNLPMENREGNGGGVSQTFASWNQIGERMRGLDVIRQTA